MPQHKLPIRDVCRIALDSRLSNREAARVTGVSASTVGKYRNLMQIQALSRKDIDELSEIELLDKMQAKYKGSSKNFIEPDWDFVYQEYQKRDVTIALLYQEYVESCMDTQGGNVRSESSFGRKLREHCKSRGLSMRQEHLPGQEMFVDYSGKHLYLTSPETGERTPVEIFVASLGFSRMIFATAVKSQKKIDWIEANTRALEFFGGVPMMVVPDNLKSAVTKPGGRGREAIINRSYADFADHYKTVIVPARPLRPQDKSLAEIGVRIVNMRVIAALRNHVFHNLSDMNKMILERVHTINGKIMRRLGESRQTRFDDHEKGCLMPLPPSRHEYTEWRDSTRVPKDYHIQHNKDYYSVPHHLAGRTVSFCITRSTIRIYSNQSSTPVAMHSLGPGSGVNITHPDHMPEAHRLYKSQNVESLIQWAESVDDEVKVLFDSFINNKRIPVVVTIRQMSKVQKLGKLYGYERLIHACQIANTVGTQNLSSLENILKMEIDLRNSKAGDQVVAKPINHENVRGPEAYKGAM